MFIYRAPCPTNEGRLTTRGGCTSTHLAADSECFYLTHLGYSLKFFPWGLGHLCVCGCMVAIFILPLAPSISY